MDIFGTPYSRNIEHVPFVSISIGNIRYMYCNDTCVEETCQVALDVGAYPAILAQGWHLKSPALGPHPCFGRKICLALGVQPTEFDNKPCASLANL